MHVHALVHSEMLYIRCAGEMDTRKISEVLTVVFSTALDALETRASSDLRSFNNNAHCDVTMDGKKEKEFTPLLILNKQSPSFSLKK